MSWLGRATRRFSNCPASAPPFSFPSSLHSLSCSLIVSKRCSISGVKVSQVRRGAGAVHLRLGHRFGEHRGEWTDGAGTVAAAVRMDKRIEWTGEGERGQRWRKEQRGRAVGHVCDSD